MPAGCGQVIKRSGSVDRNKTMTMTRSPLGRALDALDCDRVHIVAGKGAVLIRELAMDAQNIALRFDRLRERAMKEQYGRLSVRRKNAGLPAPGDSPGHQVRKRDHRVFHCLIGSQNERRHLRGDLMNEFRHASSPSQREGAPRLVVGLRVIWEILAGPVAGSFTHRKQGEHDRQDQEREDQD